MKMLKGVIAIIAAATLITGCLENKTPHASENSFHKTLEVHLQAIQQRNLSDLAPTVADSVIMISPFGHRMNSKEVFIDFHKNWFAFDNWEWKGNIVRTEKSDSLGYALIEYLYTQTDSTGKEQSDRNYLVLIFKNSKDGWLLVHDQNTGIQQP